MTLIRLLSVNKYKVLIIIGFLVLVVQFAFNSSQAQMNSNEPHQYDTSYLKNLIVKSEGNLNPFSHSETVKIYDNPEFFKPDQSILQDQPCDPINRNHTQYTVHLSGKTYPQYLLRNQNHYHNFKCLNNSSETKVILAWNKFYGETNFGYGLGRVQPFINHNCPVTNCELTMDKSRLEEADYVIVHMSDRFDHIPTHRNQKTRWVWMLIESQYYTRTFSELNGLFNYTSDFLYESEFGSNYESQKRFLWAKNESFNEKHNYHAGKTGFMTALISNCGASNKRMNYIRELKKHVEVQIYGRCGISCPDKQDCREYVAAKYKFYFSFENSFCRDYITEKFFLMLKYDIVPVVFGSGDYSRFIPKSGYIDAKDFKSPEHLAKYLNHIDSNVTAYNEFFQWKKHVNFLDNMIDYGMICDMCMELHLERFYGVKKNVINNFDKYWNKQKQCHRPDQIPQLSPL